MQRYVRSFMILGLFAMLAAPGMLQAQNLRPEKTLYIKPRVGVAFHLGDTEQSPFNLNLDNWKVDGKIPYAGGLELGYQFSQTASVSLGGQITNHPLVFVYGPDVPSGNTASGQPVEDDGTNFTAAQLLFRFGTPGRVSPFLAIGGHVTFGQDGRINDPAFGPSAGAGLDVVLSDRTSLVLEWISNFTFPDDAFDSYDEAPGTSDGFAPFDLPSAVTLGFKYNFKSAFTPVMVSSVNCPTTLQAGQSGTFTAMVNDDATQPVEYRWEFGDAGTGTGMSATHTFETAGNYTVTFTATNRGSNATQTCTVNVTPPPVPAAFVNLNANPNTFEVCAPTAVQFTAEVRGDQPVTYNWNFGDGTTGTGPNPTHQYTQPGTYNVSVTISNASGRDTRNITVNAQNCTSVCRDITELNSVYFGANSSTLTDEGRAALRENIDVLKECPTICVRIEGWAGPGERNAQQLAEARSRAVEQFYIDNGVSGSRLMAVGMGRVTGTTSKKEGANQYRRVDSIPMACDLMGSK